MRRFRSADEVLSAEVWWCRTQKRSHCQSISLSFKANSRNTCLASATFKKRDTCAKWGVLYDLTSMPSHHLATHPTLCQWPLPLLPKRPAWHRDMIRARAVDVIAIVVTWQPPRPYLGCLSDAYVLVSGGTGGDTCFWAISWCNFGTMRSNFFQVDFLIIMKSRVFRQPIWQQNTNVYLFSSMNAILQLNGN